MLAANVGVPAADVNVEMSISPNVAALAAVACPVARTEEHLDILYVMLPPAYGSAEWLALASLAVRQHQQAQSAWLDRRRAESAAAMERELDRARQIQMRLVPRDPRFEGLDVAIGFEPCKQVGGDYVDAVMMADGRVLLTVADVCGKGLHAALIASSVHTMVRAGIFGGLALPQLVDNVNRYLCETLPVESFVTMVAVAVDTATGVVEVINAGHPPPLVVGPGNAAAAKLESDAKLPLGIEESPMATVTHQLKPGQVIALYTDGLSELSDAANEQLGIDGLLDELRQIIAQPSGATASTASGELIKRLNTRLNGRLPDDDRTFLLARRT